MDLKDKKVIVVGGSSGIGLAVAKAAAAKGALVTIVSRNEDKLAQAVAEIDANAEFRVLDASKEDAVMAFFESIEPFDHLVCTINPYGATLLRRLVRTLDETDTEAARDWMEVKFWGQYYCAKYGARKLTDKGSITLTGGAASKRWIPNHAAIAATNAAVGALGTLFAKEIGPKRINVICPGLVATPVQDFLSKEERETHFRYKAEILPVKHVASPEEVALSYIYVMECDYHTADVLVVDGGGSVASGPPQSPGYAKLSSND
jgi:NAD(P)-dependent dehydrogenase (short-subunit alcohol dehydrogenase family)